ncbi:MAG: MFS transporter, partial [Acidimicrobiales bacterium]|nr:MFS transporter [Acidimicrobiales bacterium]
MEKFKEKQNRLLWAALLCGFIAGFDSTSTFILFPAIRSSLGNGDTASTTWILTIVGIVSAAILLQAGHLADRYGHNRIMISSAGASVVGSLLSAISPNLAFLIIGRGLQAAALAGLGVSSIAIIVRETNEGQLATAMGRWAFWTATAGVTGPVLSSIFVEYASWRILFLSVVPISTLVIYLGFPSWNSDHRSMTKSQIDYLGTLAAMFGISLF